ncbi:methyl-accepting chemotaxis protein [Aminivibrio sp.]
MKAIEGKIEPKVNRKKRQSMATKIILVSLLSTALSVAIVTAIALIPFSANSKEAVQFQADIGARSLEAAIATRLAEAESMAGFFIVSGRIREIIENHQTLTHEQLRKLAKMAVEEVSDGNKDLAPDQLAVTDASGIVIVRSHTDRTGDDLSKMRETVRTALGGKMVSALEEGREIIWTASAISPVHDKAGKVIGTIVVGYDMTNPRIVDAVKETIGAEITLFRGDERINTTIQKADGSRAVGTKLDPAVADVVLKEGKTYTDEADILGIPYITTYAPLRNNEGKIIGICFAGGNLEAALAERNTVLKQVIGTSVLLVLLFGAVLFFVIRRIVSPLKKLVPLLERVEKGDFALTPEELTVKSNDEIGHVAELFCAMVLSIREALRNATEAGRQTAEKSDGLARLASNTSKAADRIAEASRSLSDLSQDNAASLEEANASVEEIASGASMGAQGATSGAESAYQGMQKANEAGELVQKTITDIAAIGRESSKTMISMRNVEGAVNTITSFVGTISAIADQTNLLALNAAIEAARAGDAGRGFAVVAEEVRHLAEESNRAAGEVRTIVDSLRHSAVESLTSMESVDTIVESTSRNADTAGQRLTEALFEVEKINEILQSIAAATEEQAAASQETALGIESVSRGMVKEVSTVKELAQIADETKRDAETVLGEAQVMKDIAETLASELRQFKI